MTLLSIVAGPLTLLFDDTNGFLRFVRYGEFELVRGVFAAVRDRNWNTIPFSIDDLQVKEATDSFSIQFVANSLSPDIAFRWQGWIDGTSKGKVRYRFRGEVVTPFYRNRIGLCVLHPSGVLAGCPCEVEHVDGSTASLSFPYCISPDQPFKNVRSISHRVESNIQARVTLEGDTFETEDQRNWTDASFKTYSTPLDLPFPVLLESGAFIDQSVTIELIGAEFSNTLGAVEEVACRVDVDWTKPIRRPAVGFQWPASLIPVQERVLERLKTLGPDHLRVDIWLNQGHWRRVLLNAIDVSQAVGAELEIALFVDSLEGSSWHDFAEILHLARVQVARILLFHIAAKSTPNELAFVAFPALREIAPMIPVAIGTNAYFAELNRGRPVMIDNCLVCYSINPQVHAFDNLSLIETLEAQRATVDSAAEYFNRPVVVSPISFRPRFNPNATSALDLDSELEAAVDPRQKSGFGAAWTIGVFASLLTHTSVDSLTLYESHGPRGIMDVDGVDYPMTESVALLLGSDTIFMGSSTCPLEIVALGIQSRTGENRIAFGNLSGKDVAVCYETPKGGSRRVTVAAESVRLVDMQEDSNDA
jgi:hypothetical protein